MFSSQNVTRNINILGAIIMFWRLNLNIPRKINYFLCNILPLSISLIYAYLLRINNMEFVTPLYKNEGIALHIVDKFSLIMSSGFVYFSQLFYLMQRNKMKCVLQNMDNFYRICKTKPPNLPLEYFSIASLLVYCQNNKYVVNSSSNMSKLISMNIIVRLTQAYVVTYLFRLYTNVFEQINMQIKNIGSSKTNRKNIEIVVKNLANVWFEGFEYLKQLNDLFNPLFVGIFWMCLCVFISDVYHVFFLTSNAIQREYEEIEFSVLRWKIFRIFVFLSTITSIIHVCSNLSKEVSIILYVEYFL